MDRLDLLIEERRKIRRQRIVLNFRFILNAFSLRFSMLAHRVKFPIELNGASVNEEEYWKHVRVQTCETFQLIKEMYKEFDSHIEIKFAFFISDVKRTIKTTFK